MTLTQSPDVAPQAGSQAGMSLNELLQASGLRDAFRMPTPLAMFHLHTRWSHDSMLDPQRYIRFARRYRVSLLCITDHGTTRGAREAARCAADAGLDICVPLAMEAYAKEGHLGCLGIQQDITARSARDIVREVRAQGGVSVYNHPYQYGRTPDLAVAELVDFIEYPNNRTSADDNFKALQLAIRLKKPVLPGADVHQTKELRHALVHLQPAGGDPGLLAIPLPSAERNYFDKISEVFLKTITNRTPDYLLAAIRSVVRKMGS